MVFSDMSFDAGSALSEILSSKVVSNNGICGDSIDFKCGNFGANLYKDASCQLR